MDRQRPLRVDEEQRTRARQHYRRCALCEHRCGVDRSAGGRGPCRAGTVPRVFRHRIEYGEEAALIPTHELYLSGCDLRCAFCIAGIDAFDPSRGRELTAELFNEIVAWGIAQGARNIQWVGGEPTIHLPALLDLMADCPNLPPVVWKSDFFCTPQALDLLDGVVDIHVADFKFGNDACAKRIAGVDNYVAILTRNLRHVASQAPRLIVRHLLMPGHFDCCYRPVVRWMQENLPDVEFSLRDGYLPSWRAHRFVELSVPLARGQGEMSRELALEAGLRVIQ